MANAATRLTAFVLDQLAAQPLRRRIELCRDLASLAPTPAEAKRFAALADDLAAIEARHRQLVLDFQLRRNA